MLAVTSVATGKFIRYPTPANLSLFWVLGVLLGFFIFIQITTGFFLAFHFTPVSFGELSQAFSSVEHLVRDVYFGWITRLAHAAGASAVFFVAYVHIGRALYFRLYTQNRKLVWISGTLTFFLLIALAFMGYVLPWGQMSFWAATVITNLITVFPFFGENLVRRVWGGLGVDSPTLTRFFVIHYILPFILVAVAGAHVLLLHNVGSSSRVGVSFKTDGGIPFDPYYTYKDFLVLVVTFIVFAALVTFKSELFFQTSNFMQADPFLTPAHIVPEWYYLPFYAILRAVPNKTLGVAALAFFLISLLLIPMLKFKFNLASMQDAQNTFFWMFVIEFILLAWLGACPAKPPFYFISQFLVILYFSTFFVLTWSNNR